MVMWAKVERDGTADLTRLRRTTKLLNLQPCLLFPGGETDPLQLELSMRHQHSYVFEESEAWRDSLSGSDPRVPTPRTIIGALGCDCPVQCRLGAPSARAGVAGWQTPCWDLAMDGKRDAPTREKHEENLPRRWRRERAPDLLALPSRARGATGRSLAAWDRRPNTADHRPPPSAQSLLHMSQVQRAIELAQLDRVAGDRSRSSQQTLGAELAELEDHVHCLLGRR